MIEENITIKFDSDCDSDPDTDSDTDKSRLSSIIRCQDGMPERLRVSESYG